MRNFLIATGLVLLAGAAWLLAALLGGPSNNIAPSPPTPTAVSRATMARSRTVPEEGWQSPPAMQPSMKITHEGSEKPDVELDGQLVASAAECGTRFVDGWLKTDVTARRQALEPVAAASLVKQLAIPGVKVWKTTPAGPIKVIEAGGQMAVLRQIMADGRAIELSLILSPDATHGWRVNRVLPAKGGSSES